MVKNLFGGKSEHIELFPPKCELKTIKSHRGMSMFKH